MFSIVNKERRVSPETGTSAAVSIHSKPKTYYFPFLDGIRGITSLYVVFFHIIAHGNPSLSITPFLLNFFRFGHEAVVIFIVLSGFVLTFPLINLKEKKFPDGLSGFIKRRAKRILPAYYMALLMYPLFLLAIEILSNLSVKSKGIDWVSLKQLFFSFNMFSHLLLLQNLKIEWSMAPEYNIVLWSMATEWCIYFIFAILLMPIWRKWGVLTAFVFSVLLGLVPLTMHIAGLQTLAGYPHLVGAFGMGMFTAALFGNQNMSTHYLVWRKRFLWVAGIAIALFTLISVAAPTIRNDNYLSFITDLSLSVACAAFIYVLVSEKLQIHNTSRLSTFSLQILEARPTVFLGKISYSLYLTHVINFAMLVTILDLPPVKRLVNLTVEPLPVRLFVVIPGLILFAYGFYLIFEKPFINKRKQTWAKVSPATEKVPLP